MKYVRWTNHRSLIRNFLFLLFGIYLGFFYCLFLHGQQLDDLIIKNEQLKLDLTDCKQNNEILEKEKKQRSSSTIRSIKFHFEEKVDPFFEADLLTSLYDETNFIRGKEVDMVRKSPEFIYRLLHEKTFKAKETQFKIKVKIIYIQTTTEIWISAKEVRNAP